LVLCPTRELAEQLATAIRLLAKQLANVKVLCLCGGTAFTPQARSLQHGAHILVGTPGRIEDHLRRQSWQPQKLQTLVLDEADRILDMGFLEAIEKIMAYFPKRQQKLFFSATFNARIQKLAADFLHEPVSIVVEEQSKQLQQCFYELAHESERMPALSALLMQKQPKSALVFCQTKQDVRDVERFLYQQGFSVLSLHGDLQQWEREQALIRFQHQTVSILVATDIAARGLHIDALDVLVNMSLAEHSETHIHRIGRTARAGCLGFACSFYGKDEKRKAQLFAEQSGSEWQLLPSLDSVQKPQAYLPPMACVQLLSGKKKKLRAGDIVGALSKHASIKATDIGKITILDQYTYVAIAHECLDAAHEVLKYGSIKGRKIGFRVLV